MKKYKVVFHMEAPIKNKDIKNQVKIFGAISDKMQEYIFGDKGHNPDDVKKFYEVKEVK